MRRIIHVDQDCFYASVEMRDHPELRGIPLGIAGLGRRSVLTTCNYEAREFGCRSAMPTYMAMERCPSLRLVAPDFHKYEEASRRIRAIFHEYTDLVEPLSLDEAYLDVSRQARPAAVLAEEIRRRIGDELDLPSSAGIGPNKMLAKIASDWNKPNGQFEVRAEDVSAFMRDLPLRKLWGVGPKTEERLAGLGLNTCEDLQKFPLPDLLRRFGKFGAELHALARGRDERPVKPRRKRKSLSVERTFSAFLHDFDSAAEKLDKLHGELMDELKNKDILNLVSGIFLKVKFSDFQETSLSRAGLVPEINQFSSLLAEGIGRNEKPVRLLGVGVSLDDGGRERQLEFFDLLQEGEPSPVSLPE